MNKLGVIFVLLLFYAAAFAQERIATSTRWTDMGQDEAGVQMYVSFNMLGKEIALESADTTLIENEATTRCRYRLSNFSDKEVLISQVSIKLFSRGREFDIFQKDKSVIIKPWQNHYGAFLTPKLRKAQKVVESATINIRAKPIK